MIVLFPDEVNPKDLPPIHGLGGLFGLWKNDILIIQTEILF